MLSYKTIEPHTLELLKKLTPELFLAKARLVGGTALALQYGHRMSIDLNFFGDIEEDSIAIRDILRSIGPISVYKETTNIKIYSVNGIKVDFVNYKYPWIDSVIKKDGLRLASPKDIAAMKINAIEGRGTKKDFIDKRIKRRSLEVLKENKILEIKKEEERLEQISNDEFALYGYIRKTSNL